MLLAAGGVPLISLPCLVLWGEGTHRQQGWAQQVEISAGGALSEAGQKYKETIKHKNKTICSWSKGT